MANFKVVLENFKFSSFQTLDVLENSVRIVPPSQFETHARHLKFPGRQIYYHLQLYTSYKHNTNSSSHVHTDIRIKAKRETNNSNELYHRAYISKQVLTNSNEQPKLKHALSDSQSSEHSKKTKRETNNSNRLYHRAMYKCHVNNSIQPFLSLYRGFRGN